MSEHDTARTLVDSVFGGRDLMHDAYEHGSMCADTVRAAVDAHERQERDYAAAFLDGYVRRAPSRIVGLRNLCSADVVLIAQLLRTERTHGYAVAIDEDMSAVQTAALDAVNYAGTGEFDSVDAVFDGIQVMYGAEGMHDLLTELVELHVSLRRMIREDHHP